MLQLPRLEAELQSLAQLVHFIISMGLRAPEKNKSTIQLVFLVDLFIAEALTKMSVFAVSYDPDGFFAMGKGRLVKLFADQSIPYSSNGHEPSARSRHRPLPGADSS